MAGSAALIGGFAALYTRKGGRPHRRSGIVFVYAMLAMSVTGAAIALASGRAPMINVPSAALSAYLVITGLTTVHPLARMQRRIDIAATVAAGVLAMGCIALAVAAIAGGGPQGGAAYPLVMFGAVSLAAARGDRRVIQFGPLRGAPRGARRPCLSDTFVHFTQEGSHAITDWCCHDCSARAGWYGLRAGHRPRRHHADDVRRDEGADADRRCRENAGVGIRLQAR